MKKLLVAVLACAMITPAFAAFDNVKITGEIQTIGLAYEGNGNGNYNNVTDGDAYRGATGQVLFGIGADIVEDVRAQLTFDYSNYWGNDNYDNEMRQYTPKSMQDVLNRVIVKEAYVAVSNVFDALEVKVGRQFYGNEKSAVMYLGPSHGYAIFNSSDYTVSADGAVATYEDDSLTLTAVYFKAYNRVGYYWSPYNRSVIGLDGTYKFTEELSAQAYIYDESNRRGGSFGFYGVKPSYDGELLKVAAEYAQNYGSYERNHGYFFKGDVALPLEFEDWNLTPRFTFATGGKNFSAGGNLHPGLFLTTIIFFEGFDATLNNGYDYHMYNIGTCMKFAALEKFGFALDFYSGRFDGYFIGNSWEAKVMYDLNEYVNFNLTGAILTNVNQSWKQLPTALQLGMGIKF